MKESLRNKMISMIKSGEVEMTNLGLSIAIASLETIQEFDNLYSRLINDPTIVPYTNREKWREFINSREIIKMRQFKEMLRNHNFDYYKSDDPNIYNEGLIATGEIGYFCRMNEKFRIMYNEERNRYFLNVNKT